ncbi:MAG: hypothetical protein QF879_02120 [Candidatus Latescibacteria bacterium]|nr:hypothetical protein [Candidatus Latescibacterota bacterium]
MNATRTGGSEAACQKEGHNSYTIREFLIPIVQTFPSMRHDVPVSFRRPRRAWYDE